MIRLALSALLALAAPAYAQAEMGDGAAAGAALRCVHAVMTDSLVPVGAMREQVAASALARCFDEIEGAAAAAAGSTSSGARVDAARATVRSSLYVYALELAWAGSWADASFAEKDTALHRTQLRD